MAISPAFSFHKWADFDTFSMEISPVFFLFTAWAFLIVSNLFYLVDWRLLFQPIDYGTHNYVVVVLALPNSSPTASLFSLVCTRLANVISRCS